MITLEKVIPFLSSKTNESDINLQKQLKVTITDYDALRARRNRLAAGANSTQSMLKKAA